MTCEDYFSVIPWPQFVIVVIVCLFAGIGIGIYVERHQVAPRLANLLHPSRDRKKGHE